MDTVEFALACYRTPLAYHDRLSLAAPLPHDMDRLLWLANGSPEVTEQAVRRLGAKPRELREAARFCIQQLCLARGADPYRVLGLEPGASPERIRDHHRLLMRLFHPDRAAGRETWTDHYASRVNEAWTTLSRLQTQTVADTQPAAAWILTLPDASDPKSRPNPSTENRQATTPSFDCSRSRFRMARRWLSSVILGGLVLAISLALAGIYWAQPPAAPSSANQAEPESAGAVMPDQATGSIPAVPDSPPGTVTDRSAIAALSAVPDWWVLARPEPPDHRQTTVPHQSGPQVEQDRHAQLATEETLLQQLWMEQSRIAAKVEPMRMEQARLEWLIAEQRRLEQMKADQAQAEQLQSIRAKVERLFNEQRRLRELQAEELSAARVQFERRHDERQSKQERLERMKIEQARAEQQQRAKDQAKTGQDRIKQARSTMARDRPPPAATVDAGHVTIVELENLLARYTHAYQRGDLNSIMALFTAGARGKGGNNLGSIRQDYAALFASHQIRQLWLRDWRWTHQGESANGSGRYELRMQQHDGRDPAYVKGNIHLRVSKQNGQVLIEAIDYDWRQIE